MSIKIKGVELIEKWGVPFFFFLLYIIWPTNNSTVDGWGYAEEIKFGYNLFRPHHLLYNAFGYGLIQFLNFLYFYPEVLPFLNVLNALFAFFILLVLGLILGELQVPVTHKNLWLFFVGSSFGFWRFATENEVYLLAILLSLIASYYFLFAFFSHGNAEFMVVLIVIIPILFSRGFGLSRRFLWLLSLSMFIWNFSLAIFPNNRLDYNNHEELVRFVRQHPAAVFVVRDKHAIATRFYYQTGVSVYDRLFEFPHDMDDPELCSLQNDGVVIYSDVFSRKTPLTRASLLTGKGTDDLVVMERGINAIPSFYGEFTMDRISVVCD